MRKEVGGGRSSRRLKEDVLRWVGRRRMKTKLRKEKVDVVSNVDEEQKKVRRRMLSASGRREKVWTTG